MQSTSFLTTSAVSYSIYLCLIRQLFGGFNLLTASYIPAFMSSVTAIVIERPSRRNLLCLYVANVATESLWRMMVDRGLVEGIQKGQVVIFGVSTSLLVYYLRKGWHFRKKDSIYDVLKFIIGKDEEGGEKTVEKDSKKRLNLLKKFVIIQQFLKLLTKLQNYLKSFSKHEKCPHENSCIYYCTSGGTKLFAIGLGIQSVLKLVLQIPKIIKNPKNIVRSVFSRDTVRIGLFLGGFSTIYRVS